MEVDLRKLKLSDQLKKVNEIIDSDFSETSIITNEEAIIKIIPCLLYTSPSPRDS